MKRKKRAFLWIAAALLFLLLTGCNSSSGKIGTEDTVGINDVNDGVIRGGNLIFASSSLNFWPIDNATIGEQQILRAVFEPLGRYNDKGEMEGFLADQFLLNFEDNALTIQLKPGIMFQDGSLLNAETVKWNIDMIKAYRPSAVNNFTECNVIDENTVKVCFETLDLYADRKFGSLLMSSQKNFEDHIEGTLNDAAGNNLAAVKWCKSKRAVGTGPFTLEAKDYRENAGGVMRAWDGYRVEGQPYLDTVEFVDVRTMDNISLQGGFVNEAFSLGNLSLKFAVARLIGSLPEFYNAAEHTTEDDVCVTLIPNSSEGEENPLSDVSVRKALAYALEYEGMNKALNNGMSISATQLASEGTPAYEADIRGYYKDLEQAKQLLQEAGYSETNKLATKIMTTNMNMEYAVAIQGEWLKTGMVSCDIEVIEYAALQGLTDQGLWEGFILYNYPLKTDTAAELSQLFGTNVRSCGKGIQKSGDIYEKAQEALKSKSAGERVQAMKEANQLIYQECLVIPLFIKPTYMYANKKVHGLNMDHVTCLQWTPECTWMEP